MRISIVITLSLCIPLQLDPADFVEAKKIRYHWGGEWEQIGSMRFKYNGGQYVDKITQPSLTLEGVVKLYRGLCNFHERGWFNLYGHDTLSRTQTRDEKQLLTWWAVTTPDSEGLSHLCIEFHRGEANAIFPLDGDMSDTSYPEGIPSKFDLLILIVMLDGY